MPDIPIWPQCNIGCVFCSNPVQGYRGTQAHYSFAEFRKKWDRYKAGRDSYLKFSSVNDYFNFTGGEPTIHPDFLRILALVRKDFPDRRIKLLSNGRMFSYRAFAERCLKLGGERFEVAIPMFGPDAKSHESISRTPGSYRQTVEGIENVLAARRPGQRLEIRVILTKLQMRHLERLLAFLGDRFPEADSVDFLFVEIEGFAERYAESLKMPMRDCASWLDRHYDLLARFKAFRLFHFPLCMVPLRLWPHVWNTLDRFKVGYPEPCNSACSVRSLCVGVHNSYLKHMGGSDVAPVEPRPELVLTGDWYHPIASVSEPRTVERA